MNTRSEKAKQEARVKTEAAAVKEEEGDAQHDQKVKEEKAGIPAVKTEAGSDAMKQEGDVKQEDGAEDTKLGVKEEAADADVKEENVDTGVKDEAVTSVKDEDIKEDAAEQDVKLDVRANSKGEVKNGSIVARHSEKKEEEDRSHIRRKAVQCGVVQRDTIDWNVAEGGEVESGQLVATAGLLEQGTLQRLTAPCNGRLYILSQEQVDELQAVKKSEEENQGGKTEAADKDESVTVAFVEYCIHPVRNGRTCLMCLAVVDDNDEAEGMESVNVVSHGQVIRLNMEEAKKFDSDNIRRQLGAKKLSLVLDLDHTLLHAVRVDDVVGEIPKTDDTHFFFIPGLAQQHVVKLRPGLTEFLTELSALYDLFIYTHGTRLYAEQIAKIIDPDESYFHNRIVARTDTPDMLHKSLKLLFPSCDDSMILVLDDRIDVWKENEGNVFLIEPYHYFKCTAEINNASGQGVGGADEEESADDTHLQQTMNVLKYVHEGFYKGHEMGMKGTTAEEQMTGNGRDVKVILSERKRSILRGCRIVFSGVFPIASARSHESHYLWRLAVDLGAVPSMVMKGFPLTHLVIHPERLGTQKHVQAKAIPGVLVVTPDWILKCARSWSRVPEQEFLADEWKAKHTSQKPVEVTERADAASGASSAKTEESAPVVGDATAAPASGAEAAVASDASTDAAVIGPSPPLSSAAAEAKSVTSILVKRGPGDAKKGKQVTFAQVIDDSGNAGGTTDGPTEERTQKVTSINGMRKRMRAKRQADVSARPRAFAAAPVATGVVATGGTFDFLSKIRATRRETPASIAKPKKTVEVTKKAPVPPPKDVDDAFLRLIEAEERENELEQKRKRSSESVKDMLSLRREKKEGRAAAAISSKDQKGKRFLGPDANAAKLGEKRARLTSTGPSEASGPVAKKVNEEDDDDDDDMLDDLEADILDDF